MYDNPRGAHILMTAALHTSSVSSRATDIGGAAVWRQQRMRLLQHPMLCAGWLVSAIDGYSFARGGGGGSPPAIRDGMSK